MIKNNLNRRSFLKTSAAAFCTTGIMNRKNSNVPDNIQQNRKVKIRQYRTLGRTGFKASDIGFGASLLGNPAVLNEALDMGVNYIDTGEHYGNGLSETTIGEVISKRTDREKVFITTKINVGWGNSTKEGLKERFLKCLGRLKTNYADCLMIHMTPQIEQIKHEAFHAAFEELKSDGKVRFLGLSNHGKEQSIYGGTPVKMEDVMLAAAEDGRFDAALFVYNFLQKEQGEKIIRKFKEKNMGVTLMKTNPVNVFRRWKEGMENYKKRGGKISQRYIDLEEGYKAYLGDVDKFKEKYNLKTDEQIRDAAIKFTLTNKDVHSVCPSINNFEDLNTFVSLSGQKLENTDTSLLLDYEKNFGRFYCRHACGICESACPFNVPVNTIMRFNHYFDTQGQEKHAMNQYANLKTSNAEKCMDCDGLCEKNCPYNVPIHSLLLYAHQNLTLA